MRNSRGKGSSTALPLRNKNDEYPRKFRADRWKKFSNRAVIISFVIISTFTIVGVFVVWEVASFVGSFGPSRNNSLQIHDDTHNSVGSRHLDRSKFYDQRHLDRFSELKYALEHSELVLLYFAASWCPMSTPVSEALDEAFGNDVLLNRDGKKKTLSIVYISSDRSLEEYNKYIRGRQWLAISFESPERNNLKRHFATCAHRELEELQFDRKHEIPTGIVIDSTTQGIITTNGADDVSEMGAEALDHWLKIQQWASETANNIAQS